ncbi:MAG: hypothetical protein PHC65_02470 [Methanobacteriaceae archaeon]|jgi:hypothetical protein|uniref:hypothetical protein n=1 Tax=Methanobrevibacter TaxID=2172 RepID=UPI002A12FB33|nr:hypothetical protein [Methanobacteriaceae archaeon]MDD3408391.1 hypothetical protein [Methanobacteriaceae archaeon]MDD4593799.1 hypothetical protein [Methanobacteriaceae archaeon]
MLQKQFLSKLSSILQAQPKVCAHPLAPVRYKIIEDYALIINNIKINEFDTFFIDNYYDIHFLRKDMEVDVLNLYDVVEVSYQKID